MPRLLSVNVGLPRDIEWRGRTVHTGIWKEAVQGRRRVNRLNVEGDGQGDLGGHGGEQRAVFVYQIESYRYWAERLGRRDFTHGQFGENFTIEGLPDDEVCIGDRFRIGTALFEVTQPRTTCYRVGIRLDEPQMAALLTSSGRPGFYFRVLEEGEVGAGDPILPVAGGPERMTVAEVECAAVLLASPPRAARACAADPGALAGLAVVLRGVADEVRMRTPTRRATPAWSRLRLRRPRRRGSGHCGCRGINRECVDVISLSLEPTEGKQLDHSPPRPVRRAPAAPAAGRRSPLPELLPLRTALRTSSTGSASSWRPIGAAGSYLNDHVQAGDILDVSDPRGSFILQPGDGPVVLLSAGIGATPVLAMLHALAGERLAPGSLVAARRARRQVPFVRQGGAAASRRPCARARSRLVQPTRCG